MNKLFLQFRAWKNGEYSYSENQSLESFFAICEDQGYGNGAIIEQWTGLLDKKGTEIYDGDIVLRPTGTIKQIRQVELDDGSEETTYVSQPPKPWLVSNRGYAFFLGTVEKPEYCGIINYANGQWDHRLEVVGNIHQNSDLLNEN